MDDALRHEVVTQPRAYDGPSAPIAFFETAGGRAASGDGVWRRGVLPTLSAPLSKAHLITSLALSRTSARG